MFACHGGDALHGRQDAHLLAVVANLQNLTLHAALAALEHATCYLEVAETHSLCLAEFVQGDFLHGVVLLQVVLHVHDVLQA